MDMISQFLNRDFQAPSSNLRRHARRLWEKVGRKAVPGYTDTWVKAILYRCTGKKSLKESIQAWKTEVSASTVASFLMESILERKDDLANDPAWQSVLMAETEDEQLEAIEAFFSACLEIFRQQCVEAWRNTKGTFSYYYRRTQNMLRENLNASGWRLYEPRSRFYGPNTLVNPRALDEMDSGRLLPIPIPEIPDFEVKKLFYKDPLVTHAKWFYEKLAGSRDDDEKVAVAIRNFVFWLCQKYNLLDSGEISIESLANRQPADDGSRDDDQQTWEGGNGEETDTETLARNLDIDNLAKMAMIRLNEKERAILLLRLQGFNLAYIAVRLGLSGPSHVSYYLKKIGKTLKAIKLESPALCSADDEDSPFASGMGRDLEYAFTEFFVAFCKKEA